MLYAISQLTSSYLMSQNMQTAQRAMLLILPIAFIPFVLNFPSGLMLYWLTTNLWTTGQGLITQTPRAEAGTAAEAELEDTAEGRGEGGGAEACGRAGRRADAPARAQGEAEEGRLAAVSDLSIEMTGETVGEAKWAALRELERMRPGLEKAAVRFQVVTEGERGLARRRLRAGPRDRERRRGRGSPRREPAPAVDRDESEDAARLRELVERIAREIGVQCTIEIEDDRGGDPRCL